MASPNYSSHTGRCSSVRGSHDIQLCRQAKCSDHNEHLTVKEGAHPHNESHYDIRAPP